MDDAAGGPARHIPVLLDEVMAQIAPRDGGVYVDGTFGGGGYSRALLERADCRVVAIDRDPVAVAAGQRMASAYCGRLILAEGRFSRLDSITRHLGFERADGVTLDVGVSSMQIDDPARGFSFSQDGPLDMRMGGDGPSAADVVNAAPEADLARILHVLGEERRSRAVARAIVRERGHGRIETTGELVAIVARVVRPSRDGIHPATRTFQALRIYVNDELGELAAGLGAAERLLRPTGRLAVVSFHSLEDRLVKQFMTARAAPAGVSRHMPEPESVPPSFRLLTRKPVTPGERETAANPRARSARLRAGERTCAPAGAPFLPDSSLPRLATAGVMPASRRIQ